MTWYLLFASSCTHAYFEAHAYLERKQATSARERLDVANIRAHAHESLEFTRLPFGKWSAPGDVAVQREHRQTFL